MTVRVSYSHARDNLADLWDEVEASREAAVIRRRGHDDMALIPADELASLRETAYLLRSPKNAARLLAALLVLDGYRALQGLAEARLAEVGRLVSEFFAGADGFEPIESGELLRRTRSGDVVVIDVRPPEEYAAGHIAGALSVPLADLERRLAELPRGKRVVAYCRGPYCVLSAEAVRRLRRRGRDALRLHDGYPEWRDAGLPVAAGLEPPRRAKRR